MTKKSFLFLFFAFLHTYLSAQTDTIEHKINKNRKWILGGVNATLWGGTFYTLNKTWYANHDKTTFHLYNDWGEWQQMDKFGHLWSAYQIADHSTKLWQWAGLNQKKALVIGGISSMAYLSIIELQDGRSEKWGFSIPDMIANTAGALMHMGQGLLWKDQRIRIKMSYMPERYGVLQNRADDLFGRSHVEKLLKDYNGQTYWASINIQSFFPQSNFPSWLNLAIGFGANNMLGGYNNTWVDENGTLVIRNDLPRYRRMFLSADIDLTKIKTNNKTLQTIFSLVNVLKFPAPSIEFNRFGKTKIHPLFY